MLSLWRRILGLDKVLNLEVPDELAEEQHGDGDDTGSSSAAGPGAGLAGDTTQYRAGFSSSTPAVRLFYAGRHYEALLRTGEGDSTSTDHETTIADKQENAGVRNTRTLLENLGQELRFLCRIYTGGRQLHGGRQSM